MTETVLVGALIQEVVGLQLANHCLQGKHLGPVFGSITVGSSFAYALRKPYSVTRIQASADVLLAGIPL